VPITVRVRAVAVAVAVLLGTAGCGLFGEPGPEEAVEAYLAAWSAGDAAGAAALTDDPARTAALLTGTREALDPVALTATAAQVRAAQDLATASVDVTWDLGEGRTWSYLTELQLDPDPERGWRVRSAPTVVHPQLTVATRLAVRTEPSPSAPVVDRRGVPLLEPTPVVSVLLDRTAAGDLPAVTGALAAALAPLDPSITQAGITDGAARTPDGQAHLVAVLRETDYRAVRDAIYDLPGVRFTTAQRLLAPDAGFARQVLTPVRTEVAPQLDGVPGWSVVLADSAGDAVETLTGAPPQPGSTVAVSLDRALQTAAEDAVEPVPQQAVLVAVAPSTGEVLAVAQNPAADAEGPIALIGRYPPGSTFKIVTAGAAIEEDGLTADTPVACPGATTVDGRTIPNIDGFDLGTVPLRTAFARSCNTTFAQVATQLAPDALPSEALEFGLGADYRVPGIVTVTGSVPVATTDVQRAENGIGQGEVLASPFGMALVAATAARGEPVVPQLIAGRATEELVAPAVPAPAVVEALRPLMRAVVTEGSATALAGLGEVHGKTGTAEFTDDGRAHGWFVGYRGDVALAVLVVDGGSSAPAVEVARRFLAATP
jgi:cell division protein FtsI/penicillin-binding protein 2